MSRSSSRLTSGFSSTPRTSVKIAAFAPMPSASVRITIVASPLLRISEWNATLRSRKNGMILVSLSRGILAPSPLTLPDQFGDILRRTYLDCSTLQLHSRRLGNELNCVIQIARFQHLNSTQLLFRLRVRTVCHCNLSVLPRHGHRRVGGLKRCLSDKMSVLPQLVVVAKTLVKHGVALALRHVFELAGFEISQTDVSHPFLLV